MMKSFKGIMWAAMIAIVFTSCKNDKKNDMGNGAVEGQAPINNPIKKEAPDNNAMENAAEGQNVAEILESSEKHTTLLGAMKDAGIIVKLEGTDPYTVFAPTNAAFKDLPRGTIENLMKSDNLEELESILSYHIIPGIVDSAKLRDLIKNSKNGEYVLVTANDGKLRATINDAGNIVLIDSAGDKATVVNPDMMASNGVVHSINSVLMRN